MESNILLESGTNELEVLEFMSVSRASALTSLK